jgi:hypothetical protein
MKDITRAAKQAVAKSVVKTAILVSNPFIVVGLYVLLMIAAIIVFGPLAIVFFILWDIITAMAFYGRFVKNYNLSIDLTENNDDSE